jgi:hypothetical protein
MPEISTERLRKRGPTYDQRLIDHAKELRRYGDSIRAIAAVLPGNVPPTTVQYWVQHIAPDASGRWSIVEAAAKVEPDAAVVLAELGAVMFASNGQVSGITRDEARWVTLIARVRPDLPEHSPGKTWQLARRCIEAVADADEADLQRVEALIAQGAARMRWPRLEQEIDELRRSGERVAADIAAGRDPFLDGRPYESEEEDR